MAVECLCTLAASANSEHRAHRWFSAAQPCRSTVGFPLFATMLGHILRRFSSLPPRSRRHHRRQRRAHLLVQHEQMLDAFTFRRETLSAIETIDSAIQRVMRPSEVRRHQVRIVQVCQCRARVGSARLAFC